jgi:hypothetical protein
MNEMTDWSQIAEVSEENAEFIIKKQNEDMQQIYTLVKEVWDELKKPRIDGKYGQANRVSLEKIEAKATLIGEIQGLEVARTNAWNMFRIAVQKKTEK